MANKLTVFAEGKKYELDSDRPVSFIDAMEQLGLFFYRPCGGKGSCGGCAIRFIEGAPKATEADVKALGGEACLQGYRLGCKCTIDRDCQIEVGLISEEEVEPGIKEESSTKVKQLATAQATSEPLLKSALLAVDIGTTTLGVEAIDTADNVIDTYSWPNKQAMYGADVVSRIEYALKGGMDTLSTTIRKQLKAMVNRGIVNGYRVEKLIVAANTTMNHLLLRESVKELAAYPFSMSEKSTLTGKIDGIDVYCMPNGAPFIGGDIVSGIFALELTEKNKPCMLLDLGTNAEIVLWDGAKLWATSTSAGPALEAANISCGMPCIEGAIAHVKLDAAGQVSYVAIGEAEPKGVCGSAVVDIVACLYQKNIIDAGGLFSEQYQKDGFKLADGVIVSGEDVQQVLLAKSAIYSSITILCQKAGVKFADIDKLFVAGGLGASVDAGSAVTIGLIPKALERNWEAVGNTSLKGAVKLIKESLDTEELVDKKIEATLNRIASDITVIDLAKEPSFEELFLANLVLN